MARTEPPNGGSVQVDGLDHDYGNGPVLNDVSLDVAPGECIALLGPSGCGKTTLLRSIAGLEHPDGGTVTIGGSVVSGPGVWVAPERRQIGMVFQDWALFPHLDVAANVAYGLGRSARGDSRIAESLGLVGLDGWESRMPATLSGGQQQRVALARALAPRPRVLLLDEPFSNLDTSLRAEVRTEVHHLLVGLGITSIFVTHDQEEAFVVGDRVAVMERGCLVQVDTPQAVYTTPANRWVAEFVGDASILRCDAKGERAVSVLGDLPIESGHDGTVDVMIRPEQLALVEGDRAVVDVVEFYGHDAMVFLTVEGQQVRARTGPTVGVRRGDRVGIEFRGTLAHAFPTI